MQIHIFKVNTETNMFQTHQNKILFIIIKPFSKFQSQCKRRTVSHSCIKLKITNSGKDKNKLKFSLYLFVYDDLDRKSPLPCVSLTYTRVCS